MVSPFYIMMYDGKIETIYSINILGGYYTWGIMSQ